MNINVANVESAYYSTKYLLTVRVLAGISLASCVLVVVSFLSFSSLRKASGHYSLWVSLSNILHCLCVIIDGGQGTILCSVTGFLRAYANFAMFVVSVLMASRMVSLLEPQRLPSRAFPSATPSTMYSYGGRLRISSYELLLVWVAPIPLACVPFLAGGGAGYGKPPDGQWCWLNSAGWSGQNRYLFLYYYVPFWLTVFYVCGIYGYIFIDGRKRIDKFVSASTRAGNSQLDASVVTARIERLINTLRWYPFNLVFVNIVPFIITIMVFWVEPNTTLLILQMYTENILGLLDSGAYFLLPSVQAAWASWFHRHFVAADHELETGSEFTTVDSGGTGTSKRGGNPVYVSSSGDSGSKLTSGSSGSGTRVSSVFSRESNRSLPSISSPGGADRSRTSAGSAANAAYRASYLRASFHVLDQLTEDIFADDDYNSGSGAATPDPEAAARAPDSGVSEPENTQSNPMLNNATIR